MTDDDGLKYFEEGRAYAYMDCAEYLDAHGQHIYAAAIRLRLPKKYQIDKRPENCTNRLMDEGKDHPKSGCLACTGRLFMGCPHEAKS